MAARQPVLWPPERAAEALRALAERAGYISAASAACNAACERHAEADDAAVPLAPADPAAVGYRLELAAAALGCEVEPVTLPASEAGPLLSKAGPALIWLPGRGSERWHAPPQRHDERPGLSGPGLLALIGASGARRPRRGAPRLLALGPDRRVRRWRAASVEEALCAQFSAAAARAAGRAGWAAAAAGTARAILSLEDLLTAAGVAPRRRRARSAALREPLHDTEIGGIWVLRPAPGGSLRREIRAARLPLPAAAFLGAHAARQALSILSWWVLGTVVLSGRADSARLAAWALLLATLLPLRAAELRAAAAFASRTAIALERRLLAGILCLDPDLVRREGPGRLLAKVLDGEALELRLVTGSQALLVALAEIALAVPLLAAGAAGWRHAALLMAWLGLTALVARLYWRRRGRWTAARLALTRQLIERMLGHRTRRVQRPPAAWHTGEDPDLDRYLDRSRAMDRLAALLRVAARGWLLVSLAALMLDPHAGRATARVAVSLGGLLLAGRGLGKLAAGLGDLAEAHLAWRSLAPILRAARSADRGPRAEDTGAFDPAGQAAETSDQTAGQSKGAEPWASPGPSRSAAVDSAGGAAFAPAPGEQSDPVLFAHQLAYRHRGRPGAVLRGCSLQVARGERLLLTGDSGSGKSTLASLLAGLRVPRSGVLLLDGLDRHTLGASAWHRLAAAVPQLQDNHVFSASLAFNLLMGRDWPPDAAALAAAEAVCRELGLGPLLDRMPAGFDQPVGEAGWQLSHGEKGRLFVARALLQAHPGPTGPLPPLLLILDESLAALDPETLDRTLDCVLRRAPTLILIAHP
ncbi:MAG TPA: ATP-binding cassette domain-containing protein [Thermoanaerobaculia bacterium]|nr:ATP-binding cassette domain-containing protein [Thermoanaerobaculia bacterium]